MQAASATRECSKYCTLPGAQAHPLGGQIRNQVISNIFPLCTCAFVPRHLGAQAPRWAGAAANRIRRSSTEEKCGRHIGGARALYRRLGSARCSTHENAGGMDRN